MNRTSGAKRASGTKGTIGFLSGIGGLVGYLTFLFSCVTLSSPEAFFRDTENRIQIRRVPEGQRGGVSGWFAGLTSDGQGPALSLRVSVKGLESLVGEVELTSPLLPALRFRGILSQYGPAELLLQIHSVRIFDNWNNGWTEGEAEAFGTILFRREYLQWWGILRDPFSMGEVKSGEVRYFDRYYRGEEGTHRVQVRLQRLLARISQQGSQEEQKTLQEKTEADVEESPGLYLSLQNLYRLNQQLGGEELLLVPSED